MHDKSKARYDKNGWRRQGNTMPIKETPYEVNQSVKASDFSKMIAKNKALSNGGKL